jgi:hypothetical protein
LLVYVPISIIGYLVYGSFLSQPSVNTILDAVAVRNVKLTLTIKTFDIKTGVIVKICSAVMIAHIISAFPIVVNPIFLVVYFSESLTENEVGSKF